MTKKIKIILISFIGLILIIIDQFSKRYILKNPEAFRDFSIGDFLNISLSKNYGLAFSLKTHYIILILLISLAIIFLLNLIAKYYKKNNLQYIFLLAIILAGAISNVIDRLTVNYVIDFINIPYFSTFNFADIYISLGITILIIKEYNLKKNK